MRNWIAQLKPRILLNCDSYFGNGLSYLLQCIRENGCDDVLLFSESGFLCDRNYGIFSGDSLRMNFSRTRLTPSEMALVPPRNGCSRIFPGKGELLPPFASSKGGNLYLFCSTASFSVNVKLDISLSSTRDYIHEKPVPF